LRIAKLCIFDFRCTPFMREYRVWRDRVVLAKFDKFERLGIDEAARTEVHVGYHKSRGPWVLDGYHRSIWFSID